jgi:hypothetical protein
MPLDLSSSVQKVMRALLHFDALQTEMGRSANRAKRRPAIAEPKRQRDGMSIVFYAHGLEMPKPIVALMLGDILHNLRSALDHLAWQLVLNGSDPKPEHPTRVQFPIYSVGRSKSKKKLTFTNRVKWHLPGVGAPQRAFVDRYQPYHRGQDTLALLARLSNTDKHRMLNPIRRNTTQFDPHAVVVTHGYMVESKPLIAPGQPIKDGTPFFFVRVDRPEAEVDVNTSVTSQVTLEDGAPLVPTIRDLLRGVVDILGDFELRWGALNRKRLEAILGIGGFLAGEAAADQDEDSQP